MIVFLLRQSVLKLIIQDNGGNDFSIPHDGIRTALRAEWNAKCGKFKAAVVEVAELAKRRI